VFEIITAARKSQETGRRIELASTFKWSLFSQGTGPASRQ
jgi:hypothetical protein